MPFFDSHGIEEWSSRDVRVSVRINLKKFEIWNAWKNMFFNALKVWKSLKSDENLNFLIPVYFRECFLDVDWQMDGWICFLDVEWQMDGWTFWWIGKRMDGSVDWWSGEWMDGWNDEQIDDRMGIDLMENSWMENLVKLMDEWTDVQMNDWWIDN